MFGAYSLVAATLSPATAALSPCRPASPCPPDGIRTSLSVQGCEFELLCGGLPVTKFFQLSMRSSQTLPGPARFGVVSPPSPLLVELLRHNCKPWRMARTRFLLQCFCHFDMAQLMLSDNFIAAVYNMKRALTYGI